MKTHDLIDVLSTDDVLPNTQWMSQRVMPSLLMGTLICCVIALTVWSVRADMTQAMTLAAFWFKLAFAVSLALISLWVLPSAVRPISVDSHRVWLLLAPVFMIWLRAVALISGQDSVNFSALIYGQTWQVCTLLIVALAMPLMAVLFWALREAAPSHPKLTGFVAGILSGAIAASIYSIHCTEMSPFFVGIWYLMGILVTGLLGCLLGQRLLRW
jgi:hypothetical protein